MKFDEILFFKIKVDLEKSGAKVFLVARIGNNKPDYTILAEWETGVNWEIIRIEDKSANPN